MPFDAGDIESVDAHGVVTIATTTTVTLEELKNNRNVAKEDLDSAIAQAEMLVGKAQSKFDAAQLLVEAVETRQNEKL